MSALVPATATVAPERDWNSSLVEPVVPQAGQFGSNVREWKTVTLGALAFRMPAGSGEKEEGAPGTEGMLTAPAVGGVTCTIALMLAEDTNAGATGAPELEL